MNCVFAFEMRDNTRTWLLDTIFDCFYRVVKQQCEYGFGEVIFHRLLVLLIVRPHFFFFAQLADQE